MIRPSLRRGRGPAAARSGQDDTGPGPGLLRHAPATPGAPRRSGPQAHGDAPVARRPPPVVTTTCPEPGLAARTGSSATLENDITEFLGTGGEFACEVTGLTAATEEIVAARPKVVWATRGQRVEPGMHPGTLARRARAA